MKTTKINIRKLTADTDHVLVSKAEVNIAPEGMPQIMIPETYGKEIYLAADASPEDFEEISEAMLQEILDAAERVMQNAQNVVDLVDSLEQPEEVKAEEADDSN